MNRANPDRNFVKKAEFPRQSVQISAAPYGKTGASAQKNGRPWAGRPVFYAWSTYTRESKSQVGRSPAWHSPAALSVVRRPTSMSSSPPWTEQPFTV